MISRLAKKQMLRNMATLVSGAAIAQIIGVLAAPIISRLYTPEDYGALGSLVAITGVVSVVSSLKYEMAIVLEKNDRKADALQALCLLILFTVVVLAATGFYLAPLWLNGLADNPELAGLLPWGSLIILFTGLYNIFSFRLNRERKYKRIASANVVWKVSTVLVQIIWGYVGATALGLVVGNVVGTCLCVLVLVPNIWKMNWIQNVSTKEVKESARAHYRFAAYSAPQNLINSLSQNMPLYLLGYFFGIKVVGSYFFATRLLRLPSSLIGQSVRQVFYKEASDLVDKSQRLFKLFYKTTIGLSILAVPMILIIFFSGPSLFPYVFGSEWRQAGEISRWMVLWVGIGFMNSPAVSLFNILGMQKAFAYYDLALLFSRTGALVIGGYFLTAENTIIVYSLVGAFFNLLLILSAAYVLKRNFRKELMQQQTN